MARPTKFSTTTNAGRSPRAPQYHVMLHSQTVAPIDSAKINVQRTLSRTGCLYVVGNTVTAYLRESSGVIARASDEACDRGPDGYARLEEPREPQVTVSGGRRSTRRQRRMSGRNRARR